MFAKRNYMKSESIIWEYNYKLSIYNLTGIVI